MSLEGGGGKGAAYIGALSGLAEISHKGDKAILKQIKVKDKKGNEVNDYVLNTRQVRGVAGASAGAITATLLACGYSLRELDEFVKDKTLLNSFYDGPKPGMRPVVDSNRKVYCEQTKEKLNKLATKLEAAILGTLLLCLGPVLGLLVTIILSMIWGFEVSKSNPDSENTKDIKAIPPELKQKLLRHFHSYLKSLLNDYGLFSGCTFRIEFDKMIAEKAKAKISEKSNLGRSSGTTNDLLFSEFKKLFDIELVLTGTNLESGKSMYFSSHNTPDFKVSDAVRISMSIPPAFKPVKISAKNFPRNPKAFELYEGTWVDGGVLNNNPIHAFDQYDNNGMFEDEQRVGVINKFTLGLRLGKEERRKIEDIFDYGKAIIGAAFDQAEYSQIRSKQEQDQTIQLGIGNLQTMNFTPPESVIRTAVRSSNQDVVEYFGASGANAVISELYPES